MSYDCSFSMRYLFFIYRLYTRLYHASLVILSGMCLDTGQQVDLSVYEARSRSKAIRKRHEGHYRRKDYSNCSVWFSPPDRILTDA